MNKVLITGGSSGIGKALALEFASRGYSLLLTARSFEKLTQLSKEIMERYRVNVNIFAADLNDSDSLASLIQFIVTNPIPDMLILNAGLYLPGKISELNHASWKSLFQVNFLSQQAIYQAIEPFWEEKKAGKLFITSSSSAKELRKDAFAYSLSKNALHLWGRGLFESNRKKGIQVCVIVPGSTLSNSWENSGVNQDWLLNPETLAKIAVEAVLSDSSTFVSEIEIRPAHFELD
jgi:short-subunit dehydrogenase